MLPRSAKPTPATLLQSVFSHAALSLLTPEQRRLYGIRWTRLDELTATALPGLLLQRAAAKLTADEQIPKLRTEAMAQPFGGRPRPATGPGRAATNDSSSTGGAADHPGARG